MGLAGLAEPSYSAYLLVAAVVAAATVAFLVTLEGREITSFWLD